MMLNSVYGVPVDQISSEKNYQDISVFFMGRQMCEHIVKKTGADIFTLCHNKLTTQTNPPDDTQYTVEGHHRTFASSPEVQFKRRDKSTIGRIGFYDRHKSTDRNLYTIDNVVKELSVMKGDAKIHQVRLYK